MCSGMVTSCGHLFVAGSVCCDLCGSLAELCLVGSRGGDGQTCTPALGALAVPMFACLLLCAHAHGSVHAGMLIGPSINALP
jgi:hypothetical protein